MDKFLLEARGWRFTDALTDSELQQVFNIADKNRTPHKDPKVLVDALPDPDKLIKIAMWLDITDVRLGVVGTEVQTEIRVWAANIRKALKEWEGK